MYGPGVEKIFEEVCKVFPSNKVEIFSSDYMKKNNQIKNLFEKIKKNKVDILVGTQMISKGFNFPKLNCIVVIDADFSGRGYDLRTTEKNIQLYHQLSGRAGRFSSESLIIIPTSNSIGAEFIPTKLTLSFTERPYLSAVKLETTSLSSFKH